MIFVEIFHNFGWSFATRIRIRFNETDPADQIRNTPYLYNNLRSL